MDSTLTTFALVGPGKVGRLLGRLLVREAGLRPVAVVGRDQRRAADALEWICEGEPEAAAVHGTLAQLDAGAAADDALRRVIAEADLLAVLVPDDEVAATAARLAGSLPAVATTTTTKPRVAFHASGLLAAAQLAPLEDAGYVLGSLHPLCSVAEPALAVDGFPGTPCAVEGAATEALCELVRRIGGEPVTLEAHGKPLYHAAAVVACNYLVTLEDAAAQLMAAAGLGKERGLQLLLPLVRGTVEALATLETPAAALTGPIERGDVATVEQHLAALKSDTPHLLPLYRELGRATLALAEQRNSLTPEARNGIQAALEADDAG